MKIPKLLGEERKSRCRKFFKPQMRIQHNSKLNIFACLNCVQITDTFPMNFRHQNVSGFRIKLCVFPKDRCKQAKTKNWSTEFVKFSWHAAQGEFVKFLTAKITPVMIWESSLPNWQEQKKTKPNQVLWTLGWEWFLPCCFRTSSGVAGEVRNNLQQREQFGTGVWSTTSGYYRNMETRYLFSCSLHSPEQ